MMFIEDVTACRGRMCPSKQYCARYLILMKAVPGLSVAHFDAYFENNKTGTCGYFWNVNYQSDYTSEYTKLFKKIGLIP